MSLRLLSKSMGSQDYQTNRRNECRLRAGNPSPRKSTCGVGGEGHRDKLKQCPLYPQKRTLIYRVGMSALCQKRTCATLFDYPIGERQRLAGISRPIAFSWDDAEAFPLLCLFLSAGMLASHR